MILRLFLQIPAWVIRVSLEASLIALLVLLAQFLLRDRVSARWRYNLWLLVIARLLLPALPQSRLSPFNWMQVKHDARAVEQMPVARTPAPMKPIPMPTVEPVKPSNRKALVQIAEVEKQTIEEARYIDVPAEIDDAKDSGPAREPEKTADSIAVAREVFPEHEPEAAPRRGKPVAYATGDLARGASGAAPARRVTIPQWIRGHWRAMGLITWATIAALLLLRAIFTSIRISLIARRLRPIEDAWVVQLLNTCCVDAGVSRAPVLVQSPANIGPALVGLWNPRLLLPARVLETLNRNELRLVILHELVHLRRRDVAMNWVLALLGALHWFNPILWWAFARLRADRELACDEAVLEMGRRAGTANDARDYGRAMLKLLEAFSGGASSPAAVGVLDGHPRWRNVLMRRRITMIARFDKPKGWSLVGMSISLLIGAIALTGAVRGQATAPDAQNAGAAGPAPKAGTTSAAGMPSTTRPGMMGVGADQHQPAMAGGMPGAVPSSGGTAAGHTQELPSGADKNFIPDLGPGHIELSPDGSRGIFIPDAGSRRAPRSGKASADPPGASPFGAAPGAVQIPGANPFGRPAGTGAGAPPAGGAAAPADESRFGHVEGPDAARADARTSENLRKPITVAFNDVALSDLTSYLADQTGADVFIDVKALEEIGIDRNSPINLTLRQPLPAEEVLRLALRSAGGDNIGYGVFHGVVTITSRLQLERSQITRAYSIADFDNRGDELINAITRTIAPETWDSHGGPSSILILGKRMIVTTAEPRHREIARLLALLREGEPGPEAQAAPPATQPADPAQASVDPIFRALHSDPELTQLRELVRNLQVESDTLAPRGDTDPAAKRARLRYEGARRQLEELESLEIHRDLDALVKDVANMKSQLQVLQGQYGSKDPRTIALQAQIDETERHIKRWKEQISSTGTSNQEALQNATRVDPTRPPSPAPQEGADTVEERPELQTLREAANDFERLVRDFEDRGETPAAQRARKTLDEYSRKIAKLAEEPRADRGKGAADDATDKLAELQILKDAAKDFEKLAQDLEDRGDTRAARMTLASVDEYNKKIARLENGMPADPVALLHKQLADAQRQLDDLLQRKYLENHPLVAKARERVAQLKAKVNQIEPWSNINGVRVPADMADEARRIMKEQFEPKIYSIAGVERNRAAIEEEFRKYMSEKVEKHLSELLDEEHPAPNSPSAKPQRGQARLFQLR